MSDCIDKKKKEDKQTTPSVDRYVPRLSVTQDDVSTLYILP